MSTSSIRLLALLCCGTFASAQGLADELGKAKQLIAEKQWAATMAHLDGLAERAGSGSETEQVAAAYVAVGNGAREERKLAVALQAFERALAIRQAAHGGVDHRDIATSLTRVAFCMQGLGRVQDALPRLEAALAMRQRLFGDADHRDVATSLNNVAAAMASLGRLQDALPHFEAALAMYQRLFGDTDHPDIARSFNNVAACLTDLGRVQDGLAKYESALAMQRRMFADRDHSDIAVSLRNVGVGMYDLGHAQDALPMLEAALAMQKRLFGEADHPDTAQSLSVVALCMTSLGRTQEALPRFAEALAMRQRAFRGDHPLVAEGLGNLGGAMHGLGRPQLALLQFETALAMFQRLLGDRDHANVAKTLNGVAACLRQLGRAEDALAKLELALAMQRRLFGESSHPNVARTLISLASCQEELGRAQDALPNYEAALAMQKGVFGDTDHPDIAAALNNMARCMQDMGQAQDALPMFEAVLAMWKRLGDNADHPGIAGSLNNIGFCLSSLNRSQDAALQHEAATAMYQRLFGETGHPAIALSLGNAAATMERLGHLETGRTRAAAAVDMIEHLWLNSRDLSTDLRQTFFDESKRGGAFECLQRLEARLGNPSAAFHAAERSRGRELLEQLEQQESDPLVEVERRAILQGDAERASRIGTLRQEIADATTENDRILHLLTRAFDTPNMTAENRQTRIAELTAQSRAVHERRRQLLDERARFVAAVLPAGKVKTPSEIQAELQAGELLLEFTVSAAGSLIHVVPPHGDVAVHALPDAASAIARHLPNVLQQLSRAQLVDARGRDPEATKASAADAAASSRALFAALFPAEVWSRVKTCRRVWLAAHGGLHRLPFEALTVGVVDGKSRAWLEDGPEIAYVHSGSAMCWLRQRAREAVSVATSLDLLAIGDPRIKAVAEVPDRGVFILRVLEGGEGARIGLRDRDVLLAYDDQELADDKAMRTVLQATEAAIADGKRQSKSITLQIWRQGQVVQLEAQPGALGIELGRGSARIAYDASLSHPEKRERVERAGDLERLAHLPPLRGALDEAKAIVAMFDGAAQDGARVRALFGADATESAVFELAANARILHLACHGIAEEFAGQSLSMLVLSQPDRVTATDDGLLKLDDLLQRWGGRLASCRLVVLSACRTQVGPLYRDEAPQALPLGLLYAGASAVIPSLWAVDDASTKELMTDFYRRLLAGEKDRLRAFTAAKKELRRKYPDPFHWAPFLYMGSPE